MDTKISNFIETATDAAVIEFLTRFCGYDAEDAADFSPANRDILFDLVPRDNWDAACEYVWAA